MSIFSAVYFGPFCVVIKERHFFISKDRVTRESKLSRVLSRASSDDV